MPNTTQNIVGQIKKAPQDIAKKVLEETSEVLDEAAGQVLGSKDVNASSNGSINNPLGLQESPDFTEEEKNRRKQADLSRLRELEAEIEKVRIEQEVKELQEKIMRGETVYLENYTDIPIEQKQVLKAQMEVVKQRMTVQTASQDVKPEPSTKPSRRLFGFGGSKKHAEDLQRSTETRMPPSG